MLQTTTDSAFDKEAPQSDTYVHKINSKRGTVKTLKLFPIKRILKIQTRAIEHPRSMIPVIYGFPERRAPAAPAPNNGPDAVRLFVSPICVIDTGRAGSRRAAGTVVNSIFNLHKGELVSIRNLLKLYAPLGQVPSCIRSVVDDQYDIC
ncbi:hypothetical protein EVAR_84831_1 [Eumeta japonica]|uniref:Uncharacterized protein n=1 Tax=Eumeta variegata TaxID=151549 RepID=A0A4C1U8B3_EUMVA|nr:hypothetical protein EVAR_84831_1 [Eumeta japonica]